MIGLIIVVGIVAWIAIAIHRSNIEAQRERQQLLEKEQSAKKRVCELKNKAWRFLTADELKYIHDNTLEIDFVTFCVNVILAGNNNGVCLLKESEKSTHYWSWREMGLTPSDFVKLCERVMEISPDTHWARLLGDKQREIGNALVAQEMYWWGITICGEGVSDKKIQKKWTWLDKAWKGQLPKCRGRRPPPINWQTVTLWRCTDLEACYFGAEVCSRHINDELHSRYLRKIESEDGYNLVATGLQYEQFVAGVIKRAGYVCEITPITDQGVDVVVVTQHYRVAVQCKYYSEPVSNSAVQEVVAGKALYKCNYACVVSNSTYTSSAKILAKANDVRLLHHGDIADYLREIDK